MTVSVFASPLREGFRRVVLSAHDQLLVACPFIKTEEAQWLVSELGSKRSQMSRVDVLTDVRSESVLNGSIELDALSLLTGEIPSASIVNLPRLHAKVYIADSSFALITSSNLTPGGLDFNFEYGIGISDVSVVRQVKADIRKYMDLGNVLMPGTLEKLKGVAQELRAVVRPFADSREKELRRRFRVTLRQAKTAFLEAQVGQRSAQTLFSQAILYLLRNGPLGTRALHPQIQQLLPELCDDSEILVINGQQFGKKWKHAVRNAQQALKSSGKVVFDGRTWRLAA